LGQQKNRAGGVPAKLRVTLQVGDGDSATLAHGVLVYGMVGGKREERSRAPEAEHQHIRRAHRLVERLLDRQCPHIGLATQLAR
jgi:hypothetical protein